MSRDEIPRFRFGFVATLTLATALSAAPSVRAGDKVVADALFEQARELMAAGKYAEACEKFDASNRVDPAVGTQLNLAACLKAAGKTASALSAFRSAAAAARDRGQTERQNTALAEAAELEAKLSYVTIQVPEEARVPGLRIALDGVEIVSSLWDAPFAVDPGPRRVSVSAEGYRAAELTVEITGTPGVSAATRLDIPRLELVPVAPSQPATRQGQHPEAAAKGTGTSGASDAPPEPAAQAPKGVGVWIALGSTVLLGAGVGVTGALYLNERDRFETLNRDQSATPTERQASHDTAQGISVANLVLLGGTLLGAGITGYLWFSADDSTTVSGKRRGFARGVSVSPWATGSAGGIAIGGRL